MTPFLSRKKVIDLFASNNNFIYAHQQQYFKIEILNNIELE